MIVLGLVGASAIVVIFQFGNVASNISPESWQTREVYNAVMLTYESLASALIDTMEIIVGGLIGVLSVALNNTLTGNVYIPNIIEISTPTEDESE